MLSSQGGQLVRCPPDSPPRIPCTSPRRRTRTSMGGTRWSAARSCRRDTRGQRRCSARPRRTDPPRAGTPGRPAGMCTCPRSRPRGSLWPPRRVRQGSQQCVHYGPKVVRGSAPAEIQVRLGRCSFFYRLKARPLPSLRVAAAGRPSAYPSSTLLLPSSNLNRSAVPMTLLSALRTMTST